ncbi:hypothetical protein Dimus_007681, partial [Dionaea muscipula]
MLAIEDNGHNGESDGSRLTAALFRQSEARATRSDEKDCVHARGWTRKNPNLVGFKPDQS